jgi:hypothetical protein
VRDAEALWSGSELKNGSKKKSVGEKHNQCSFATQFRFALSGLFKNFYLITLRLNKKIRDKLKSTMKGVGNNATWKQNRSDGPGIKDRTGYGLLLGQ